MRRIWNIVWTTIRYPRRHLRTVATDELVRKIVREIHSRRHGNGAVGISAIANHRSAVWQNAGAREIFAQPVAHVRIIKIENAVGQNMREHGCCRVCTLDFHLEHAAVGAILYLDFHRQAGTCAREYERFPRAVNANAAVQNQAAMVRHFARKHSCALAPGNIEGIGHAGKRPIAHAKSCGIDRELDIFAFYQERARHRTGWHCYALVPGKLKHREASAIAASAGCRKRPVSRCHHQKRDRRCAKAEQTSSYSRSRDH